MSGYASRRAELGQHFLAGAWLAAELAEQAGVGAGDLVVEIGAGTGVLTEALARRAGRVVAVEYDPRLAERARARLAGFGNVRGAWLRPGRPPGRPGRGPVGRPVRLPCQAAPSGKTGPEPVGWGEPDLLTAAEGSMGTLTLSTRITLLRIALIPVLLWLLVAEGRIERAAVLAAIVFLVASFTDFVDGYLARRWQQTTMLGNFLDTTADKLLVVGALLGLMAVDRVNVWVAFVVIAREVAVLGLRAIAAASNVVISASIWGKVKFNVQVVGITLAILRPDVQLGSLWLDEWAMLAVAVVSAASAVDYFARFGDLIRAGR